MTIIKRLYRCGHPRQFQMLLACGHKFVITDEELSRKQLFLGKAITCPECQEKTK